MSEEHSYALAPERDFMRDLREIGEVVEDGDLMYITAHEDTLVVPLFKQHGMKFHTRSSHVYEDGPKTRAQYHWFTKDIKYFGMPFRMLRNAVMECVFGRNSRAPSYEVPAGESGKPVVGRERKINRFTLKVSCPAILRIYEITRFPEYEITGELEPEELKSLQDKKTESLFTAVNYRLNVRTETVFMIIASKPSVHNHPLWDVSAPFIPLETYSARAMQSYNRARLQNWVCEVDIPVSSTRLEEWVTKANSSSILVRFFKERGAAPQSEGLTVEDFVLVFFNNAQLAFLREFGKKSLCIDYHVMNTCNNYLLTSVIVLDELQHAVPVAFMISSRMHSAILKIFFQTIKTAFGSSVETDVIVVDLDQTFYSAWVSVMSPVNQMFYSPWSVDNAWCENLTLVDDDDKRTSIYKDLLTMLKSTDEYVFSQLFESFCAKLIDDEPTREFGTYFIGKFGATVARWSESSRQGLGINFKLTFERAHDSLQDIILDQKDSKTLDEAAREIMAFSKQRIMERIYPQSMRPSLGRACPRKIKDSTKGVHFVEQGGKWLTMNLQSVISTIVKFNPGCRCLMKCVSCNGCAHMYVCSCPWSTSNWFMCTHIHRLCKTMNLPKFWELVEEKASNDPHKKVTTTVSYNISDPEDPHKKVTTTSVSYKISDPVMTAAVAETEDVVAAALAAANATSAAVPSIVPEDPFAENRQRIAGLLSAIEGHVKYADTEGEFEVVEELLQQVIPAAKVRKFEDDQSKVPVEAILEIEKPVVKKSRRRNAKKRKVEVQYSNADDF